MYSSDKLTIDTPEQIPLEFHLAGVGSRFLALGFDLLLQIAGWIVLGIILGIIFSGGMPETAAVWIWAIVIFLWFLTNVGYFAIFESIWNGQTPGKRLVRIRVVKEDGRPIHVADAISRNLLRMIDQQPGLFYAVGITTVMFSKNYKRLGDYVAGTVVVHEKPLEEVAPTWQAVEAAMTQADPPAGVYNGKLLTPQELQVIEAFLQRRYELSPEMRAQTATQIAQRIVYRLQLTVQPGTNVETFLETLARERRDAARFR